MPDIHSINNFLANGAPLILVVFAVLWHFGIIQKIRDFIKLNFSAKGKIEQNRTAFLSLTTPEKVAKFAQVFLSKQSQDNLADPIKAKFDALEYFDISAPIDIEHHMYGQFLFEEMTYKSEISIWLDWKYNVLTLLYEDEHDDLLNKLFLKNDLAPVTDAERFAVLGDAYKDPSLFKGHRGFFLTEIQHLAAARDCVFLQLTNDSDSSILMVLPKAQAAFWDGVEMGDLRLSTIDLIC